MKLTKLHLGCGKRKLNGYTHVDLAKYPHVDFCSSIDRLPMFPDESVELIYASHVFEYFDPEAAKSVLAEWRRVLQPTGILRLAVPDLKSLIKVYEATCDTQSILGPFFGRWPIPNSSDVLFHKTVYDFKSLERQLQTAGFTNIQPWDWREVFSGENQDFDDYSQAYYPHMDKKNGVLISLNVEAKKA